MSVKGLTPELYAWNARVEGFGNPMKSLVALLNAGHHTLLNCWPLVPEDWDTDQKLRAMASFCDSLKRLHRALPLVLTWVKVKPYPWVEKLPPHADIRDLFDLWLVDQDYTPGELLTPQWAWADRIALDASNKPLDWRA